MAAREIATQRFEPVVGRGGKIAEHGRIVHLDKLDTSKYLVFRGLGERGDVLLRM
jgi:hypothetical protein